MIINGSRPFLKWPGGKYRLRQQISAWLPPGKVLIEPFVGAGAIFLNTDYPNYILNDNNPDLINLYQIVQQHGPNYIKEAEHYFSPKTNTEKQYYQYRQQFNNSEDKYTKALLFLYLNRHGYNGLVRYNSSGQFNVPFGRHEKPFFPEKQLHYFYQHSQKATFTCTDFRSIMKKAKKNQIIYCDPPYVPLTKTAKFTSYSRTKFEEQDHRDLASLAKGLSKKGIHVLISNHNTPLTQQLYKTAQTKSLQVSRHISQNITSRKPVQEILAKFTHETT